MLYIWYSSWTIPLLFKCPFNMLEVGQIKLCIVEDYMMLTMKKKKSRNVVVVLWRCKASSNHSCYICSRRLTLTMQSKSLLPIALHQVFSLCAFFPWEWEAKHVHTNDANNPACSCYTQFFLFCTISLHSLHSWRSLGGSVSVSSSSWNTMKRSRSEKGKCGKRHLPPASLQPHPAS